MTMSVIHSIGKDSSRPTSILDFLLPMWNHLDRRSLQHRTLDALVFLMQNYSLLNMTVVSIIVNSVPETDSEVKQIRNSKRDFVQTFSFSIKAI